MDTCSLCRRDLPETPPQPWTNDDGEVVFVEDRTDAPCAVVDTSVGEITVCDQCYTNPLPPWLSPSDLRELHYQFALGCRDHGDHHRSIECLEAALRFGESAGIRSALGYAYSELGLPERAKEEYRRALALDPEHFIARENLNHLTNR